MAEYSVVATSYNDADNIKHYLIDISKQTCKPTEIVIADGGSEDNTVSLIEEFAKNCSTPIRVICDGRLNISEGYNTAIKAAQCAYVGITGIGNRYEENYFEILWQSIISEDLDYVYSPIRGYDTTKFSRKYNDVLLHGDDGNCLTIASNHGALMKKQIIEECGYFYEKFIYAGEDAEFYLRVKDSSYVGKIVHEAMVYWETPKNWKEFLKQIRIYTIADMQRYSKKQWKRLKTRMFKILFSLCTLVCDIGILVSPLHWMIKVCVCVLAALFLWVKRKRINSISLANTYLPVLYTIRYRKYMAEEYSVRR